MSTTHPTLQQVRDFIEAQKSSGAIDTSNPDWKSNLPKFPEVEFSEGTLNWIVETGFGEVQVELFPNVAPQHVANFLYLTEVGFFNDLDFHRVIPGFMAQGGCPLGTGTGGPGYRFKGEFSPEVRHDRPGLLSMANAGPNTDGSQFFLTFAHTPWLDDNHTIFGEVKNGMEALREMEKRGSREGTPSEPLPMIRARIDSE